uniref:Sushi domain-containing protein n=1 Tax=Trichuris muris TaxID=70415 RepID=A0A5S6QIF4_TRIMR
MLSILTVLLFPISNEQVLPVMPPLEEIMRELPSERRNVETSREDWKVLYPFGETAHDMQLIDRPNHDTQIDLDFFFPFYGHRFNYTFISPNGLVAFSRSDWIQPPYTFPNPKWPERSDPSFIAPFLSRSTFQHTGNVRISNVWHRSVHRSFLSHFPSKTQFELDQRLGYSAYGSGQSYRRVHAGYVEDDAFLDKITDDLQKGMNGANGFQAFHCLIVTWERMAYGGAPKIVDLEDFENAKRWQNTFQLVLATDEIRSYAIFNYASLNWTSSTDAGSLRGRGGYQSSIAGFNGGNGTGFTPLPYSARGEIFKLATYSSVDLPGRWMYRVDEQIIAGGCSNASAGLLTVAPDKGSMLGGISVNVSGPCLPPSSTVHVLFDELLVVCKRLTIHRAQCILPRFHRVGQVVVKFSRDGGRHFPYIGTFYFVPPDRAIPGVILRRDVLNYQVNAFDSPTPDLLTITWSPYNLTSDMQAKVTVDLFGYWEDAEVQRFERVGIIAQNILNTGILKLKPKELPRPSDISLAYKWKDFEFGVVRVALADNPDVGVLYSTITSFSWYFLPDWETNYGSDWALKRCINWYEKDGRWRNFWMDLEPCPCTLDQALFDIGRFMPYLECDMNGDGGCYYHRGATHCVMSIQATWTGGQTVCCYDVDGWLMHSDDYEDLDVLSYYSPGIPYRAHTFGSYPFRMPPYVPSLSNWFHDLAPYHMCCRFADKCSFLFWRRQTRNCQDYVPPTAGIAYGSAHFITFDGAKYRFSGKGYYVLTMSTHRRHRLMVQVRLEQPLKTQWNAYPNSTIITGVVARENDSDIVQVVSRKEFRRWRYKTDVSVRGQSRFFDTFDMKFQQYRGVNVWNPARNFDQSEIHIQFLSGAGIRVHESNGLLDVTVVLPKTFNETIETKQGYKESAFYRTYGLLGVFNGMAYDEFLPPHRETPVLTKNKAVYTNPDASTLYHEFGEKWKVDGSDPFIGPVLFEELLKPLNNPLLFSRMDYVPSFDDLEIFGKSSAVIKERDIRRTCGTNVPCRQAYISTGQKVWAASAKMLEVKFEAMKELGNKRWLSCGPLWKAVGSIKTPQGNNYLEGVTVDFSCRPEYFMHGTSSRTCINGTWTPGWPVWCRLRVEENALKIATGVLVSMLLVAFLVAAFYYSYQVNVKPKKMRVKPKPSLASPTFKRGLSGALTSTGGIVSKFNSSVRNMVPIYSLYNSKSGEHTQTEPKPQMLDFMSPENRKIVKETSA